MSAILTLKDISVSYDKKPVFENLSLNINLRDRICLIGKNGAGKTSLLKIIAGENHVNSGEVIIKPGSKIGYLKQDNMPECDQKVLDYILSGLEEDNDEDKSANYLAEMLCDSFEININYDISRLSGGQMRKAAIAQALVAAPDILLLDEPTNHLDLGAIETLESHLVNYKGGLLCISHDKRFLENISNRVFWLDRGNLRVCSKGYKHFEEWSGQLLEQEERELLNRKRLVAVESEKASRGVRARRKRNIQRLDNLKAAREKLAKDMRSFNQANNKINLPEITDTNKAAKIVAEFKQVSKSYEDIKILDNFNLRIIKGDRIGVIGRNGTGKTTFLKMLIQELEADKGSIKLAKNLNYSYYKQNNDDLKYNKSIAENLCSGGNYYINVGGKQRHVCSYLKDFMFDPKCADDLISTLSGGQKNRLMLAKTLAYPQDLLILDEPTNDLDMETLDMLLEILAAYKGTLIVVSHDRDFLENSVTTSLIFEGEGNIEYIIGGYDEYLAIKKPEQIIKKSTKAVKKENSNMSKSSSLSFSQRHELVELPKKIAKLEEQIIQINNHLVQDNLFAKDMDRFIELTENLAKLQKSLEKAENYWLELETLKSQGN